MTELVALLSKDQLTKERLAHVILLREIEDFYFREADLLDERRFDEWLDLLADDLRYWMPMRKNLPFKRSAFDITGPREVCWFDDDKPTLQKRVRQIQTGVHWAEEPLSRVSHLVSNVRLDEDVAPGPEEIAVKSHFLVHRNRLETETDFLAGRRHDRLRRVDGGLKVAARTIIIDQSVLLSKNLTFFF